MAWTINARNETKDGSIGTRLQNRFLVRTGVLFLFNILSFILGSINFATLSSVGGITRRASDEIAAMREKLETGSSRPPSSPATGDKFGSCSRSIREAFSIPCRGPSSALNATSLT